MFNEKYLISALSFQRAYEKAKSRGLSPAEWVYVPERDEGWRRKELEGRLVSSIEHLLGDFSAMEMAYLLRKRDEASAV